MLLPMASALQLSFSAVTGFYPSSFSLCSGAARDCLIASEIKTPGPSSLHRVSRAGTSTQARQGLREKCQIAFYRSKISTIHLPREIDQILFAPLSSNSWSRTYSRHLFQSLSKPVWPLCPAATYWLLNGVSWENNHFQEQRAWPLLVLVPRPQDSCRSDVTLILIRCSFPPPI